MTVPPAILVVEDDELVQSFLSRALHGLAGPVSACDDGAGALAATRSQRFGLILIDGLLPDVHGIELAKQLVVSPAAARSGICFVSGMLRAAQPMRSGITALPKPLRVRELADAANQLLQWHSTLSASASTAERLAVLDTLSADLLVS